MSVVTNVIINTLLDETPETIKKINFSLGDTIGAFEQVDSWKVGGTKALEMDLFIGAFNYLDVDAMLQKLEATKIPMQVLICEQEQLLFRAKELNNPFNEE